MPNKKATKSRTKKQTGQKKQNQTLGRSDSELIAREMAEFQARRQEKRSPLSGTRFEPGGVSGAGRRLRVLSKEEGEARSRAEKAVRRGDAPAARRANQDRVIARQKARAKAKRK